MLGTSFAWVTATIAGFDSTPGGSPAMKFAYTAAGVALFVYACGLALSFFLPEPEPGMDAHD
jgi:xanthine/uracil permease